jgi:hypothetical protein
LETKKNVVTHYGKDMKKGAAGTKGMMEANFFNGILTTIPTDGKRDNLGSFGTIKKEDGDGDINFLVHTQSLPE